MTKIKVCVYIDDIVVNEINAIWLKNQYANEKGITKSQVVQDLISLGLEKKGIIVSDK